MDRSLEEAARDLGLSITLTFIVLAQTRLRRSARRSESRGPEFRVGPEPYLLKEGDGLLFESRTPHWNRNPGPSKAEVLWITTPPSY